MSANEYLITFGASAFFGRFVSGDRIDCARGDRVVIQSHRGTEYGTVLCPATSGHAQLLSSRVTGKLLRRMTAADETRARALEGAAQEAFVEARALAKVLGLPLEIVDAEAVAEPRLFVVHYLSAQAVDYRPLVSGLARRLDSRIEMLHLGGSAPVAAGCTACGSSGGGCGSCADKGCGDGCGSCSSRLDPLPSVPRASA